MIAAIGYVMRDVVLRVKDPAGAWHQFSCELTGYDPKSSSTSSGLTQDVLCPPNAEIKFDASESTDVTLDVSYLVDWNNPESFTWFLDKNQGKAGLAFELLDRAGDPAKGVIRSGVFGALPGPAGGGTAGSIVTATTSIPVEGKLVNAVAAAVVTAGATTSDRGGSVTPFGAVRPADLTALKADAVIGDSGSAKPGTDTPAGESLWLLDGSRAHYATDAWVAGVA